MDQAKISRAFCEARNAYSIGFSCIGMVLLKNMFWTTSRQVLRYFEIVQIVSYFVRIVFLCGWSARLKITEHVLWYLGRHHFGCRNPSWSMAPGISLVFQGWLAQRKSVAPPSRAEHWWRCWDLIRLLFNFTSHKVSFQPPSHKIS